VFTIKVNFEGKYGIFETRLIEAIVAIPLPSLVPNSVLPDLFIIRVELLESKNTDCEKFLKSYALLKIISFR
jgi:hypothetical protein